MPDIDLNKESDPERLRQIAILQEAEIDKLHERISVMSAEIDKLREAKQGRLQAELKGLKEHLAKLQHLQFGASSEKQKRDESKKRPRRRKKRARSGPIPQPELPRVEEILELARIAHKS